MRESPKTGGWARARRALASLASLAVALALVPTLLAASLLVAVGETRPGRLSGGVAASVLVGLLAGFGAWRAPGRAWGWLAALAVVSGLGLAVALVLGAKADRPEGRSGLQSRFGPGPGLPRYSPARLVPERDQVALALNLATRPIFWSARARSIRETTLALYRSIEADPAARGLGAATHLGLVEAVGGDFRRTGHSFAYVPEPRGAVDRPGLIVFLHGNGGNFQALPWAWREFAEAWRFVILCPTFGLGFWGEGGVEAVDRALDDALARWPIDPARVYLGGISDGGVGVTRSARAHPGRYRGLIYVSPTMRLDELASPQFIEGWAGRPILVVQGGRDWNVPQSTVDPAVDLLRRQGASVTYRVFPDEDHFLFFARPTELFGRIDEWMGTSDGVPAPALPDRAGGIR